MGDILFREEATVFIKETVSAGPTTYSWAEAFPAGTWFSSPLALLQYMVAGWNSESFGGGMGVTLDSDPESAHYRQFVFQPDPGPGTITAFNVLIPQVYADCGLSSADHNLGSGSSIKYSSEAPYVLTPFWPPAQYAHAVENLTGYGDLAHDGTAYSMAGTSQRKVTLSVALDRSSGSFAETTLWMRLWRDRWTRGRAVTFFMDRSALPLDWDADLVDADVLELPSSGESLDFTRMIELKETINYSKPVEFVHRKMRPSNIDHESFNEGVQTAAPTSRVTSYYRAIVSEALSVSGVTLPDGDAAVLMFWFRVNDLGTVIVNDGWGPGGAIAAGVGAGYGTAYEVDHGGAPALYEPYLGQWTFIIIETNSGEVDYYLNTIPFGNSPSFYGDLTGNPTFGDVSSSGEIDVANVAYFDRTGVYGFSGAEIAALFAAGPTHDYANPYGAWTGTNPLLYWCGTPTTVVANSGTGGTHNLTWSGAVSYGTLVT